MRNYSFLCQNLYLIFYIIYLNKFNHLNVEHLWLVSIVLLDLIMIFHFYTMLEK
jgi:hypothetical protein